MIEITVDIVKELIITQFPEWENLKITPVEKSGNDNRTFHLGETMLVRLPSDIGYEPQTKKEFEWLKVLSKYITLPITRPIALGKPNKRYPFHWSINNYIEGESLTADNVYDKMQLAKDIRSFLSELQSADTTHAPIAGSHNYYRGYDLSVYHSETIAAIETLKDKLPENKLLHIWHDCTSLKYCHEAVWLHGDVAPGNLLVKDGVLCAVIDFGIIAIGDPSCDYAVAWTYFDEECRKAFLAGLSKQTIQTAKGWALWKALITYDDSNLEISRLAKNTITQILNEV